MGDYGAAEKDLKSYLREHADDYTAWDALGVTYGNEGRHDDAIIAYNRALEIKPDFAKAWSDLGFVHGRKGRHEDEIIAYKKAVEIKPDFAEAWDNLGAAYSRQGQHEDAILAWKKTVEIRPDLAEALGIPAEKLVEYGYPVPQPVKFPAGVKMLGHHICHLVDIRHVNLFIPV